MIKSLLILAWIDRSSVVLLIKPCLDILCRSTLDVLLSVCSFLQIQISVSCDNTASFSSSFE